MQMFPEVNSRYRAIGGVTTGHVVELNRELNVVRFLTDRHPEEVHIPITRFIEFWERIPEEAAAPKGD